MFPALPGILKAGVNAEVLFRLSEIGLVLLLFTDASRTDLNTSRWGSSQGKLDLMPLGERQSAAARFLDVVCVHIMRKSTIPAMSFCTANTLFGSILASEPEAIVLAYSTSLKRASSRSAAARASRRATSIPSVNFISGTIFGN